MAFKIFETQIPGFNGKIVYLSQGKQQGRPIPKIEVRVDKPEQALALRKEEEQKTGKLGTGSQNWNWKRFSSLTVSVLQHVSELTS